MHVPSSLLIFSALIVIFRKIGRCSFVPSLLLLASCATQRPPSGGPIDSTPPEIVETYPENGTVRFSDNVARFRFSEYIDRQSFQKSLHISPYMQEAFQIEWSGKEVELVFSKDLEKNKTYVITVGTQVKDINAGNMMANSSNLAFSTGDSLAQGVLSGTVFDDKPAGITIFAYALQDRSADTINPSSLRPDYAVQSGTNGDFRFQNIAEGMYRIFAVRDKQNNYLYESETEEYSALPQDILVGRQDSGQFPVRFLLSVEDTTAPYLQSVFAENRNTVQIKFTEDIIPSFPAPAFFRILDSTTGAPVELLAVTPVPNRKFTFNLITAPTLDEKTFLLSVDSLRDAKGNYLVLKDPFSFRGSAAADTIPPSIIFFYPAAKETQAPVDSAFVMIFSRPMLAAVNATILDSSGNDIPLSIIWTSANTLILDHPLLAEGMPHKLCIDLASCRDSLRALPCGDTTICVPFTTETSATYGSISGTVIDLQDTVHAKIVRAVNTDKKSPPRFVQTKSDGSFHIPKAPAGKYALSAFSDKDENGIFSPGKPFPFSPSERFGFATDTVRVRARWETSGVRIEIP